MEIGYTYDPLTFEYTGTTTLFRDPIDNKLMITQHTTTIPPNEVKEGFVNIFNNSMKRWDKMRDHRGVWFELVEDVEIDTIQESKLETLYDITGTSPNDFAIELAKRIAYQYDPTTGILSTREGKKLVRDNPSTRLQGISHNLLSYDKQLKCWALKNDLQTIKKKLKDKIKEAYENIETTLKYGEFTYQIDSKSIVKIQEKLLSSHKPSDTIEWVMENNEIRTIDYKTLKEVYTKYQDKKQSVFVYMQSIKKQIEDSQNYNDLANIYDDFLDYINNDTSNESTIEKTMREIFNG